MSSEIIPTVDHLQLRLNALAQESPGLAEVVRQYSVLLPILRDADLHVGALPLTPEAARKKMAKGEPLLSNEELEFDPAAFHSLMIALAAALDSAENAGSPAAEAARSLRLALAENKLDLSRLLLAAAGDTGAIPSCAEGLDLDKDLLLLLLKNALKPALRAWQRQLSPLVDGVSWNSGNCFICGDRAVLAELQGNNQAMHLRCSSCGSDWQFPRLRCVHCGNDDPGTLRFIDSGSRDKIMRAEACEQCKGYIKIIAAFEPTPPEMLPVQDLATLQLDYIAQERGYARPANP